MVVAPAYMLHLKLSQYIPFFSFGMAEYTLQAVILVLLMLVVRRFRISYLFSFVTAIIYGFLLDGSMLLVGLVPCEAMLVRLVFYVLGLVGCACGVSLLFHTYIPPEAYELFVKEISAVFRLNINRVKTVYDCVSCVLSVLLSFVFFGFGKFQGVGIGSVVAALVNGWLIGLWSRLWESRFCFADRFGFRSVFENSEAVEKCK